jgi:transposase
MIRKDSVEKTIRDIRCKMSKQYSAEEKIRIVLEGLRGEESLITERQHSHNERAMDHSWIEQHQDSTL